MLYITIFCAAYNSRDNQVLLTGRMADLPIGINEIPDEMHDSYLATYGAQRKGMGQDERIAYYNNWAKQGKYENVKLSILYCGI